MSLALAVERQQVQQQSDRETIIRRLDNWGAVYRLRSGQGSTLSFEGKYRSPQSEHWLVGQAPPAAREMLDPFDAQLINHAWQSLPDLFHQTILGGWYVKLWSEPKCVRVARETAGERAFTRNGSISAYLAMAHCLIREQLQTPAVVRRDRLVARVRQALDIPAWGIDNVAADPLCLPDNSIMR